MKKFKGFNQQQLQAIAKKLGFNGPIEKFNEFLQASPNAATQFGLMSEKARKIAEGKSFSTGGLVQANPTQQVEQLATTTASTTASPTGTPEVVPFAQTTDATKSVVSNTLNSPTSNIPAGARPEVALTPDHELNYLRSEGKLLQATPPTAQATLPNQPAPLTAAQIQAQQVTPAVKNEANNLQAVQGSVSDKGQVTAAQMDPNQLAQLGLQAPQISEQEKREATVQEQLKTLSSQFEGGKIPPWAAGMVRSAHAQMAARGLGTSSMAASAAVQAAMEAATAIATTDAQLIGQTNQANLNVRAQKMLSDAAAMSAVDMANLNNRQQAAVENAQAFLAMDFKNMDAESQTRALAFQSVVNSLFNDQAQENAARQFNATSDNETNRFFSQLASSVEVARANLNTDVSKFNSELMNTRETFNAEMGLMIDRANTQWRQQITTTDTAAQNLSNQIAAAAISRLGEVAFNALIQLERDEMSYVNDALTRGWQSGENAQERAVRLLIGQLDRENYRQAQEAGFKFETGKAVGSAAFGIINTIAKDLDWSSIFSW